MDNERNELIAIESYYTSCWRGGLRAGVAEVAHKCQLIFMLDSPERRVVG